MLLTGRDNLSAILYIGFSSRCLRQNSIAAQIINIAVHHPNICRISHGLSICPGTFRVSCHNHLRMASQLAWISNIPKHVLAKVFMILLLRIFKVRNAVNMHMEQKSIVNLLAS